MFARLGRDSQRITTESAHSGAETARNRARNNPARGRDDTPRSARRWGSRCSDGGGLGGLEQQVEAVGLEKTGVAQRREIASAVA